MATVNIYDMADTWNDGGTTFTAIKMNVTDTASNAASLLMDLQKGSSSKFKVAHTGVLTVNTDNIADSDTLFDFKENGTTKFKGFARDGFIFNMGPSRSITLQRDGSNSSQWGLVSTSAVIVFNNSGYLAWNPNAILSGASDLFLTRKAAANLRLGAADAAAPVAQTLSVQSVVAGTTNTSGTDWTFEGSQGTGSGAGGSIIFKVAPAGSSGTAQNALVDALTIGSDKLTTLGGDLKLPASATISSLSSALSFGVGSSAIAGLQSGAFAVASGQIIGFSNNASIPTASVDVRLYRDAANTLALRNAANAQTFRVYRTYTGTADEWGAMDWNQTAETLEIGSFASGTGNSRNVLFVRGGANILQLNAGSVLAYQPPCPSSDGGTSIGLTALRWNGLNLYPDTVANLPGSPAIGSIDVVNDGDSGLTHGQTVVNSGAGATPYLVWYNGTNWTVIGA